MTYGLIGVVLAGVVLWILQPLRTHRGAAGLGQAASDSRREARWKELVDAKHALYRSILDLETDRSVGKVSEEDYVILRRQQEGEALDVLHQMDALVAAEAGPPDGEPDGAPVREDLLEAEIAAARERLRPRSDSGT
ncbi:MAG TPA: hypothetical protein VET24_06520 [Actinomycetota bacterium]|nr:hypothetical protein [Actinomycetota bacterium]